MVSSIDATRQQPPPLRTRLSAKMRVLSSEIVARRQKVRSKISVATSIISDRSSQYFPAKDGTSATSKLGTSRSTSRTIPERRPKKLPLSDTAPMTAETKTVPLSEMVKSSTDITPAEEALKGALKTIDSYLKKKYDSVSDRSFRTSKTKLLMEASSSMTEDDAACKQTSTRIESARSLVKCKLYHQALTCYEALILSIPAANITIVRQRTMLLVSAWQVLCQYSHIRHCTARKIALRLRYGDEEKHVASPELIRKAVELQTEWAEESVSCQRQLYKVKQWEKRCGGKPPSARRRLLPKATTTPKKNQVVAPQA